MISTESIPDWRQAQVSLFRSVRAKTPLHFPISKILDDIQGGKWAQEIRELRAMKKRSSEHDRQKKRLPAFTMSGTCSDRKTPILHSGLLQIDLDDVNGLPELRDRLKSDKYVAFGFISPSGNGLKLGLRIDASRHQDSFTAARVYFDKEYAVQLDQAVKDALRLCFVGHDADLWRNDEPLILPITDRAGTEQTEVISRLPLPLSASSYSVSSLDDLVELALPLAHRRNNQSLFKLARGLLNWGQTHQVTDEDRMLLFDLWYKRVQPLGFLRHPRHKYEEEFMLALKRAERPLGPSPIDLAWDRVQIEPPPAIALKFTDPGMRKLAALCYQLELLANGPWFLSCRSASRMIERNRTDCAKWLSGFVALGTLIVVEHGNTNRATRYRWAAAVKERGFAA